jgi:CRP/FNR family transcriptional regulator, anaerobic regulatory protein
VAEEGFVRQLAEVKLTIRRITDPNGLPSGGPSIIGAPLWGSLDSNRRRLLTDEERAQLAVISSVVRFRKGTTIYGEGEHADAVFNIITGVVKSYKTLPDQTQHIVAFLFPDDLVGLTKEGRYVNSAEAVTAVTGYRIPVTALEARLRKDPELEFRVICKVCHELREAQRHAFMLSKHRGVAKVGLFLEMLENYQVARGDGAAEVYLPMSRSDIGEYLGLSLEAVSRSFRALVSRGVIAIRNRRHVRILNRAQLESVASESGRPR